MSIPATGRFPLSTGFGLGHMRPFPGTWGSLLPLVVAGVLIALGFGPIDGSLVYHLVLAAMILVFGAACVVSGDHAEARFGKKDPSAVVADEVVGMSIALIALPIGWEGTLWHALPALIAAFLLFRFFDITKLPPANSLQRVAGGWGILLDDVAAGLWALLLVQILL